MAVVDQQGSVALGTGLYTPAEAARLVGLRLERVRRWIKGYSYKRSGTRRTLTPLFQRDLPTIDGHVALSFLDLLEILFVRAFLAEGVSLTTIRRAAAEAACTFKTTHPLTLKRFQTDGRAIFARFKDEKGVEHLLELVRGGQLVFRKVVDPLLRQIEHDPVTEQAIRWWPLGKDRCVVLDPGRAMGAPLVADFGVPTRILHGARRAGDPVATVAAWYDVTPRHVKDAVEFEESRDKLAVSPIPRAA